MKNKTKAMITITATVFTSVFYGLRKHSLKNKINHVTIILFLLCFCFSGHELKAQLSRKVLFLGNSYTGYNNLPQLVHDVALSAGDTLVFDSHTPGGYQLLSHSADPISQTKIMTGGWNYVVLQGQSQEPITAYNQFTSGGVALYNLIKQYNPCAVTMPYMTWGRKNGDATNCASFPIMCTYQGMDTTLRKRYLNFTDFTKGEVAPVSMVWNYLRQNFPNINLYQLDESHPSVEGSYAAACCFYAMLFKKDPTLITFNFGLNASDATIIKNAAKTIVFNNLQTWDFKQLPTSIITYQAGSGMKEILFGASSQAQQSYLWDFGDVSTSSSNYQPHTYLANGTYTVSLTTSNCDLQGLHTSFSDTVIQLCNHTPTVYTAHPWFCAYDTLWTQPANAYKWFLYGTPLPEANLYLANPAQYGITGFSVMSTINGCSELSQLYNNIPQMSGYYFDLNGFGNPCFGDTIKFVVLHINGSLPGSENILWFKNDTLLPIINNDTLLITTPGKYECKVINPTSNCPLDTTSQIIEFNCGVVGIEKINPESFGTLFPNPASETITIKFANYIIKEQIQIYNAIGHLVKTMEGSGVTTNISVADLPNGLYIIRLKNNAQRPLRFIKQ
jgi:Secretion system C-terminal sorting domain/PKD domain